MEALDAALTPLQQAKYRLLELEVEQRMRDLMNRVREGRRSGPSVGATPLRALKPRRARLVPRPVPGV